MILLGCASQSAAAQLSAPGIISALPDVRSISPANAAGVLQYCARNGLVSSVASDSVVSPLVARRDVQKSQEYSAGQAGRILANGKSYSLDQTTGYLKSQACDRVLRRAEQFK